MSIVVRKLRSRPTLSVFPSSSPLLLHHVQLSRNICMLIARYESPMSPLYIEMTVKPRRGRAINISSDHSILHRAVVYLIDRYFFRLFSRSIFRANNRNNKCMPGALARTGRSAKDKYCYSKCIHAVRVMMLNTRCCITTERTCNRCNWTASSLDGSANFNGSFPLTDKKRITKKTD